MCKGAEAVVVGYGPPGDIPAGPAVWTGADSLYSTRAIQGLRGPFTSVDEGEDGQQTQTVHTGV